MTSAGSDMQSSDAPGSDIEQLRSLVRQNPKEARRLVQLVLAGPLPDRTVFLAGLSGIGDGRLRQCVANAVVAEPSFLPAAKDHLQKWLLVETDEFAKKSVVDALQRAGGNTRHPAQKFNLVSPALVGAYRYVSDRLAHELRNALGVPQNRVKQLREQIDGMEDGRTKVSLLACLGRLSDDLHAVGRLAVSNPDDAHFNFRPVTPLEWIEGLRSEYGRRYHALGFAANGDPAALATKIIANDYFMRLVFWNLWVNSHEAVGNTCKITIDFAVQDDRLRLLVLDNGTGFPTETVGYAFHDKFSKKGENRGRGLLEVQDAIEQLQGTAELKKHADSSYRVCLTFPVHTI